MTKRYRCPVALGIAGRINDPQQSVLRRHRPMPRIRPYWPGSATCDCD